MQKIGEGGFGVVYRTRRRQQLVAAKGYKNDDDEELGVCVSVVREVVAMRALRRCKFVVHLIEFVYDEQYGHLVIMEKMQHTLQQFYKHVDKGCKPFFLRKHLSQLLDAISYMHGLSIYHRDVKPSNILLNRRKNLRLADLGTAKVYVPGRCQTNVPTTFCFAPPEMLDRLPYDLNVDLWSVGCTLVELVEGRLLFAPNLPMNSWTPDHIRSMLDDDWRSRLRKTQSIVPNILDFFAWDSASRRRVLAGAVPAQRRPYDALTRRTKHLMSADAITEENRHRLVDWLYKMASAFQYSAGTIDATAFNLDDVLARMSVAKSDLAILGCVVLHLTAKLHEVTVAYVSDYGWTTADFHKWELLCASHLHLFRVSRVECIDCTRVLSWFADPQRRSDVNAVAVYLVDRMPTCFTTMKHHTELLQRAGARHVMCVLTN